MARQAHVSHKRQLPKRVEPMGFTRIWAAGIGIFVIALLALPTSIAVSSSGAVTNVNELSHPWLVKGAYANYTTGQLSSPNWPPYFVTSNGTLLLGEAPLQPKPRPSATGEASLSWLVTNRTGDMVTLYVMYQTAGCQYSETEYKDDGMCTSYSFSTSLYAEVNVTSGDSYVKGESSGLLDLWGPPLPSNGTITTFGTVYKGGQTFSSSAVVGDVTTTTDSHLIVTWVPPGGINMSGTAFKGPFYFYELTPQSFAYGENYQYGWINVSATGGSSSGSGGVSIFSAANPLGPQGFYDYNNGLAYQFSMPDYPISRTVCDLEGGKVTNCQYAVYSTSLGSYIRSGEGTMNLVATNIQLDPNQSNGSGPGLLPSYLVYVVPGVALLLLGLGVAWRRRRNPPRRSR